MSEPKHPLDIEERETMPPHIVTMIEGALKACEGHDSGDAASALLAAYTHALLQYKSREDFDFSVAQAMMLLKMNGDARWGAAKAQ